MGKGKLVGNIVLALILVTGAIVLIVVFVTSRYDRELKRSPERSASAEVVNKRVSRYFSPGHRSTRTSYTYYVTFEFPDGLVKEIKVDFISLSGRSKIEPYSSIYDSLIEGNTGILTYKEIEDYDVRSFISFEKDPEYGGTKVEMRKEVSAIITICVAASGLLIPLIVIGVLVIKKKLSP